jgi:hypothetical protein
MLLATAATWLASGYAISRYGLGWQTTVLMLAVMLALALANRWILRHVRIRAVICRKCNKVVAWGLGRTIPIAWQEMIEPEFHCTSCGYDLIGTCSARCPECGHPFPAEWLEVTQLGNRDLAVQFEIVPSAHKAEFWSR